MNVPENNNLRPLFARLQACPSLDNRITEKLLLESWGEFRQLAPDHGDEITPALMAGLVLYDQELFAPLLNEAERAQLIALAQLARERYQQKTNPPNRLGKTLAAALKEVP